jgi:plastocyanin
MKNVKMFYLASVTVLVFMIGAPESAIAGAIQMLVQDKTSKPVGDAVIVAMPVNVNSASTTSETSASTTTATIIVDQVNKTFVPHVLPVRLGTTVSFPNKDNIRHHVYSFSPAKTFELPLYMGIPASPVKFDKVGVVTLGCNIHDWMVAYVYVVDTPYFGRTGTDGVLVLNDLPAGKYLVRTWHPQLDGKESATEQQITVLSNGTAKATSVIGLTPGFNVRRAPIPGKAGY